MSAETILEVQQVSKIYKSAGKELLVLKEIDFSIEKGTTVAITGPSGSGKTTLLGICAGLDQASSGSVALNNIKLDGLTEDERAAVRNLYVGFIFQNFQLMPTLTALENVMVPMELRKQKEVKARAMELLDKVGLADRSHHYPVQLSGGEQQRVSLARAFSNRPAVLFADEPTGNLDGETGERIEKMLFDLNREAGTTLIIVTHDMDLASRTSRIIKLKSGAVIADTYAGV
ncbi:MAG TPA: ABC transporter ATP-binding protein [Pedobacter sp.]|uniref:ABC transporter ATP-binding protein n=1 Tax=Pedobacter sp. TaxID=1411316 RepID=UPI002CE5F0F3|nr:ABC transporter ATP-binding protein [Pedobacter sp.]HMI03138.1 ABC transporter ATP-binding protein [Pedobacter sp.]